MKRKLLTIGYGGFAIQEFLDALMAFNIQCLIDIREIPISRKKGFSKSILKSHLIKVGIKYSHLRSLGSPSLYRSRLRETGDYDRFFRDVRRHLETTQPTIELREAVEIARMERACLMCYCPRWELCHRRCVVEAITSCSSLLVEHIERQSPRLSR